MGIKHGEKTNIYHLLATFIVQVSGPQVASQIDAPLRNFQQTRDEILQITSFRNDSAALESLISNTNSYISMWQCIEKSLPFGPAKAGLCVNHREVSTRSLCGSTLIQGNELSHTVLCWNDCVLCTIWPLCITSW